MIWPALGLAEASSLPPSVLLFLLLSGQYSGAFSTLLWEGSKAAVPSVTVLVLAWGDW